MKVLIDLTTAVAAMDALRTRERWYTRRGRSVPVLLRAASKELTRVIGDALGTETEIED